MTTIVAVSPHPDDAVLSIGGVLHDLAKRHTVEIVTVFASDAPPQVSHLAARLAGLSGANIGAARRAEDRRAVESLGARKHHLMFCDAVHRRAAPDQWLIQEEADLYRTAPEAELVAKVSETLTRRLAEACPVLVLGPAGHGDHIDHVATAAALATSCAGTACATWSDMPYGGSSAFRDRCTPLHLSPTAWSAKVAAIACYETQVRWLFPAVNDVGTAARQMCGGADWFVTKTDAQRRGLHTLRQLIGEQ
ncbi:PIG-L family deacetylase [Aquihabitans sp. G128]|uniref:PIG-L deacetylase family protein n=1 Tax=Aquihabitans sp. G128 TaxID=2849779 RepID=UPI001C22C85C|nr:PIG-L family deacetylase [Aquihabitans sp. G128]QXC60520.1 PIG-L family deacetylase [Aquihabitans sp. G128]